MTVKEPTPVPEGAKPEPPPPPPKKRASTAKPPPPDLTVPEYEERIEKFRQHPSVQHAFKSLADENLAVDESLVKELRLIVKASRTNLEKTAWMHVVKTHEGLAILPGMKGDCQAQRGRVAEIKMSFLAVRKALNNMWTACEVALVETFTHIRTMKPEKYKTTLITHILAPLKERIDAVTTVMEACTAAESNLEALHFTLREAKEIGEHILDAKKRQDF